MITLGSLMDKSDKSGTQEWHYYACNCYTWMVDNDLATLIHRMKKERKNDSDTPLYTSFYLVPVSIDSTYEIKLYAPQVEGITFVYQTRL